MKRKIFALATIVLANVALVGCGGTSTTGNLPNLYRGAYTGTWTCPSLNLTSQTLTMTIGVDGSFSGTMNRGAEAGTFGGVVNGSGHIVGTTVYTANGNYVIGGTTTKFNGHLVGSLSVSYQGTEYLATFDVAGA